MAFSIQTNVNSLIAQENLRVTSEFQSRTINRLTSGFRINQSGDDAAGLAIANKFRSDVAELTQGVRNANDGISQLQIMDGGMNNVSKMLDRLKTLATQSASGTFTGDRTVLNKEYQTLVQEIDRQAQSIGLTTGGRFATKMSVFIGGGVSKAGAMDIGNGAVSLDFTNAVVDAKNLGLKQEDFQAVAKSSTVSASVADVVAANSGTATFSLSGPGFNNVGISVALTSGDTNDTLVSKLNNAIAGSANANLRDAGIQAAVVTDASGNQKLAFTATDTVFQASAANATANALLGNFKSGGSAPAQGADVFQTVTGAGAVTAAAADEANVKLTVLVNGTAHSITFSLASATDTTAAAVLGKITGDTEYTDAATGLNGKYGVTIATDSNGKLQVTGANNESLEVQIEADTANYLGLGSWSKSGTDVTKITGTLAPVNGSTETLGFSINGGEKISVTFTSTGAAGTTATALDTAIQANAQLKAAGIHAVNNAGTLELTSGGASFRVNVEGYSAASVTGLAHPATLVASAASIAGTGASTSVDSAGAATTSLGAASDVFSFVGLRNPGASGAGSDAQSLVFSAVDSDGANQSVSVTLDSTNAKSVDDAVTAINAKLQADTTLKGIVAVKERSADGSADGIRFLSSLDGFSVYVGETNHSTTSKPMGLYDGTANAAKTQGMTVDSTIGGVLDISTAAGAKAAVVALGAAVSKLGSAQAAVGKAQNQLGYAVALAQSQISNYSAAESRIRDADIASEAANLTKAQVLQQASMAAMAQANSAPQAVLALLRG